ncbi:hypothetical protein P5P86_13545 [Nocardioides sp. BP30]|uniref:hypothetical protein n=1 Tax=Nocardioides sp. BP30 TaxID=3036374 RepID=UPI002468D79B|nr:hypothetical protein [Nocardioides sp. BP30]WGL50986.1 hypothetical protein P5P86_13545 [Nocardioides sp. BP30]
MTDAITLTTQPVWTARVLCGHHAVLGRAETVAGWTSDDGCDVTGTGAGTGTGAWRIGVDAATAEEIERVHAAVASERDAPGGADLPAASLLVRAATRHRLPACSILLADGDQLAALAWGLPLGVVELGGWEYAVAATPPAGDSAWVPLAPGTVAALDPCGPTTFPLHAPLDPEAPR